MSQLEPPYAAAPSGGAVRGTNVMAILSLVFAFVFSPLGIVFGHIAKGHIRLTGEGGSGLATAGLVLSYIFTIIFILYILLIVFAVFSDTSA
jgi:hypothetical protein